MEEKVEIQYEGCKFYLTPDFKMKSIVLLVMVAIGLSAVDTKIESIKHNKNTYKYEKIPIYEKESNKLMFYAGEVSVINSDGKEIYSNFSNYSPGCEGNFSAISIIKPKISYSPILKSKKTKDIIIFCGSNAGRHNTIQLFQPNLGVVSTLDYIDGPVNLNVNSNGIYTAVVNYKFYMKSLRSMINYPVFYQLKSIGGTVSFSNEIDSLSENFYSQYIQEKIKSFKLNKKTISILQAYIVAIQLSDADLYCTTFKLLEDITSKKPLVKSIKNELQQFVNNKQNFKCKDK